MCGTLEMTRGLLYVLLWIRSRMCCLGRMEVVRCLVLHAQANVLSGTMVVPLPGLPDLRFRRLSMSLHRLQPILREYFKRYVHLTQVQGRSLFSIAPVVLVEMWLVVL
jgi:hypothetical protein